MKVNPKQYAESLLELARDATKREVAEIVEQFLRFLVRTRQFKFSERIIEQLKNLIRKEEGKVKIVVESANRIDKFICKQILEFFNKKENEVEFEEKIDANLLGGVRIKLNDILVDATITGQLEKLRQQLQ